MKHYIYNREQHEETKRVFEPVNMRDKLNKAYAELKKHGVIPNNPDF